MGPDTYCKRQSDLAPLKGSEEVANGIGNHAKLVIVPGGHASSIEQPQKGVEAISQFVN